jgi:hypothetical protein
MIWFLVYIVSAAALLFVMMRNAGYLCHNCSAIVNKNELILSMHPVQDYVTLFDVFYRCPHCETVLATEQILTEL